MSSVLEILVRGLARLHAADCALEIVDAGRSEVSRSYRARRRGSSIAQFPLAFVLHLAGPADRTQPDASSLPPLSAEQRCGVPPRQSGIDVPARGCGTMAPRCCQSGHRSLLFRDELRRWRPLGFCNIAGRASCRFGPGRSSAADCAARRERRSMPLSNRAPGPARSAEPAGTEPAPTVRQG